MTQELIQFVQFLALFAYLPNLKVCKTTLFSAKDLSHRSQRLTAAVSELMIVCVTLTIHLLYLVTTGFLVLRWSTLQQSWNARLHRVCGQLSSPINLWTFVVIFSVWPILFALELQLPSGFAEGAKLSVMTFVCDSASANLAMMKIVGQSSPANVLAKASGFSTQTKHHHHSQTNTNCEQ